MRAPSRREYTARPVIVDTHCHLDLPAFDDDRDQVVSRSVARGVRGIVVPAIRPATWPALRALGDRYAADGVRIALGVHPQIVPELDEAERLALTRPEEMLAAAIEGSSSIAIGECGLDGGTADLDEQERLLRAHIRVARALKLPLLIHVLRAHDRAPRILREEKIHEVGGVLHSYSGGAELVPIYAALGLHFSFAGPVAYPGSRRPLAAARAVPQELLLAETDAPDQAPPPYRGQRSEPGYVVEVVAALAVARGQAFGEVAHYTTANAQRLFPRADFPLTLAVDKIPLVAEMKP